MCLNFPLRIVSEWLFHCSRTCNLPLILLLEAGFSLLSLYFIKAELTGLVILVSQTKQTIPDRDISQSNLNNTTRAQLSAVLDQWTKKSKSEVEQLQINWKSFRNGSPVKITIEGGGGGISVEKGLFRRYTIPLIIYRQGNKSVTKYF